MRASELVCVCVCVQARTAPETPRSFTQFLCRRDNLRPPAGSPYRLELMTLNFHPPALSRLLFLLQMGAPLRVTPSWSQLLLSKGPPRLSECPRLQTEMLA